MPKGLNIQSMIHRKLSEFKKQGKFKQGKLKFMKLRVPKLKG